MDSPWVRRVMRADQSPMNPTRWCLGLDCGHEEWVYSLSRPTRTTEYCDKCRALLRETLPLDRERLARALVFLKRSRAARKRTWPDMELETVLTWRDAEIALASRIRTLELEKEADDQPAS